MNVKMKPLRKLSSVEPADAPLSVLFPHESFAAVYEAGPDAWGEIMLGPSGHQGLLDYWAAAQDQTWYQRHPMLAVPERMEHTVPYTLHGDDVRAHNNSKVYILTCSSALSRAPSDKSRLLVTSLLSRLCVKEHVHGLLVNRTADEVHRMISWSFGCLLEGKWPSRDWAGRKLRGRRAQRAGLSLAGPWRAAFVHMRGDLEFKARVFGWDNYARNNICHRCEAKKPAGTLCFRNLLPTAACWGTDISHEQYVELNADRYLSPFLGIAGFRKERVLEDWMHDVHR